MSLLLDFAIWGFLLWKMGPMKQHVDKVREEDLDRVCQEGVRVIPQKGGKGGGKIWRNYREIGTIMKCATFYKVFCVIFHDFKQFTCRHIRDRLPQLPENNL